MTDAQHYVIRGGVAGRERLRLLSRVMHQTTTALLDRLDLRDGLVCLDAGCGGGDATLELARRVAPHGRVVGLDIDQTKLDLAAEGARQQGIGNVEFRFSGADDLAATAEFDVVYARFLLTHLADPARTVGSFFRYLRPGGVIALEDIDFSGYFTYPESKAFRRYCELYYAIVGRRGGDPAIGPRLPFLIREAGFANRGLVIVQPMGITGEAKMLSALTMENIADTVVQDGLATREECAELARELYAFAENPDTLAGTPRIFQVWGRRPVQ
jgi:ubiquinone/menaquinone biosynthesis C-methylase UbiE